MNGWLLPRIIPTWRRSESTLQGTSHFLARALGSLCLSMLWCGKVTRSHTYLSGFVWQKNASGTGAQERPCTAETALLSRPFVGTFFPCQRYIVWIVGLNWRRQSSYTIPAQCDLTHNMAVPRLRIANPVSKRDRRTVHGYLRKPISSGRRVGTSDSSYVDLEATLTHAVVRTFFWTGLTDNGE